MEKPRGGDVAMGLAFWLQSRLHLDEPHSGLLPFHFFAQHFLPECYTCTTDFPVGRRGRQRTGSPFYLMVSRSPPIGLPTGRHDAMERLSVLRYLRERVGDDSAMDVG